MLHLGSPPPFRGKEKTPLNDREFEGNFVNNCIDLLYTSLMF